MMRLLGLRACYWNGAEVTKVSDLPLDAKATWMLAIAFLNMTFPISGGSLHKNTFRT
jgi:hypothetical protein